MTILSKSKFKSKSKTKSKSKSKTKLRTKFSTKKLERMPNDVLKIIDTYKPYTLQTVSKNVSRGLTTFPLMENNLVKFENGYKDLIYNFPFPDPYPCIQKPNGQINIDSQEFQDLIFEHALKVKDIINLEKGAVIRILAFEVINMDNMLLYFEDENLFNIPLDPQIVFKPFKQLYIHIKNLKGRLISYDGDDPFLDNIIEFQINININDYNDSDDSDNDNDDPEWYNVINNKIHVGSDTIEISHLNNYINLVVGIGNSPVILWKDLCKFPNLVYQA